jgi:serine-type D-Ala-D-Ala carboxypeptidase/endopeptidase (penicillin-binding protein 4)
MQKDPALTNLRCYIAVSLVAMLAACAQLPSPTVPHPARSPLLPERVVALLNEARLPQDALGVIVLRASDGATVLSHRANVAMQPASTLKVLTSIVALERLGPSYRANTELRSAAAIAAGTLTGEVVLRGLGSPDFDWRALQSLLQTLRFSGVNAIAGDVILDRSYFNPPRLDEGAPPFDESPEFRYNVIPDALLLNSNLMRLELASDDSNVRVGITPALDRVSVDSEMKLVDKPCADWEDFWKLPDVKKAGNGFIRVTLKGEFPRNCPVSTEISVLDRVDFADRLFRALWTSAGGTWTGVARDGTGAADARVLATHPSRTLTEFNRDILKRSDNPITRTMFLTLGAESKVSADALPTTRARSDHVVRQWLQEKKIDSAGLVLDNGSGLSRTERISAETLAGVLRAAKDSRWAPEFLSALPIVGVDGGMRKRLADGPAAGVARVKTGGLRNVVSVAGYVPDMNGEMCVVVAMLNHDDAKYAVGKPIVDAVLEWVTRIDSRAGLLKQ